MANITKIRDHPIFICGHPKSGTSLVLSILDAHPELVVYPEESIFFRRFLPQAQHLTLSDQLSLARENLIHFFTWNSQNPPPSQQGYEDRDYAHLSFDEIARSMETLAAEKADHPGDVLSAAVLAYGMVSQNFSGRTRFWVEKSPYNEFFAAQIFSWWPEARCVHVMRDPRDNFVSYRQKHPSWTPEFFARNWLRSTRTGFNNQEKYGFQRYYILRYEDLVLDPMNTLQKLVDFLGITWQPSLTSPTRAGEIWRGNSMFMQEFNQISSAPIGRWKERLSRQDAAVIEWMSRTWMKKLDYSPETLRSATPFLMVTVLWRSVSWPLRVRLHRFARG